MAELLQSAQQQTVLWLSAYGYHAVVPALLADPGGVPWAWVFLMLLAHEAGKSVPLMLIYGFSVLTVTDHVLYWIGVKGGQPLLHIVEKRWPGLADNLEGAAKTVREKGLLAVLIGRFLPVVGRFVGIGAGLADIPYAKFALFDAGGVLLTVAGFGGFAHLVGKGTIDAPWFPGAVCGVFIGGFALTTLGVLGSWLFKRQRAGSAGA